MATLETDLADRHRSEGGLSRAEWVSLAGAGLLAAVNVYRAWSQSITYDEAYAYWNFLTGPIARVFSTYHVNNHVLQSALSWLAVHWFGMSEFTLRLPSVLGGLLYLVTAWRLSRLLFGRGWFHALAVAALCLNPFTLDYLSAARGYGLGVALLLWAFYHAMRHFDGTSPLWKAGVGLGLAVASTLVFLYPALALGTMVCLLLVSKRRLWAAVDEFAGPGLVAAFVLLVVPLTRVRMEYFYYGAASLAQFSRSLVDLSLFHNRNVWRLGAHLPGFGDWQPALALGIIPAIIALAVAAAALAAVRLVRRRPLAADDRLLLLAGGTLGALMAMVLATHYGLGVPYPLTRTGIYWAPLVTLACLGLAWKVLARRRVAAALPFLVLLAGAVVLFAAGFTTDFYAEWKFDRNTRRIVEIIRSRERGARSGVRVGATWIFEPSLNFYRRRFRIGWMRPVERKEVDAAYDYYVLAPVDHGLIAKRGLAPLYRDNDGGAVLAVPGAGR